jgi:hypothetical protein
LGGRRFTATWARNHRTRGWRQATGWGECQEAGKGLRILSLSGIGSVRQLACTGQVAGWAGESSRHRSWVRGDSFGLGNAGWGRQDVCVCFGINCYNLCRDSCKPVGAVVLGGGQAVIAGCDEPRAEREAEGGTSERNITKVPFSRWRRAHCKYRGDKISPKLQARARIGGGVFSVLEHIVAPARGTRQVSPSF